MKFGRLFLYVICLSLLAAVVALITDLLQGAGIIATGASLTFITFICWAAYFLFGASIKGGVSAICGFIVGIAGAILIFELIGVFAGWGMDVSALAIPAAVFVVVVIMALFEKVPHFDNIPAIFLGTGMFFGLMGGIPALAEKGYVVVAGGELLYALIGFAAGWLSVIIRVAFEKGSKTEAGT